MCSCDHTLFVFRGRVGLMCKWKICWLQENYLSSSWYKTGKLLQRQQSSFSWKAVMDLTFSSAANETIINISKNVQWCNRWQCAVIIGSKDLPSRWMQQWRCKQQQLQRHTQSKFYMPKNIQVDCCVHQFQNIPSLLQRLRNILWGRMVVQQRCMLFSLTLLSTSLDEQAYWPHLGFWTQWASCAHHSLWP